MNLKKVRKRLRPSRRRKAMRKATAVVDDSLDQLKDLHETIQAILNENANDVREHIRTVLDKQVKAGIRAIQRTALAAVKPMSKRGGDIASRQMANVTGVTKAAIKEFLNTAADELELIAKKLK